MYKLYYHENAAAERHFIGEYGEGGMGTAMENAEQAAHMYLMDMDGDGYVNICNAEGGWIKTVRCGRYTVKESLPRMSS